MNELGFAGVVFFVGSGCSGSPSPTVKAIATPPAMACPSVIGGSVHDLDDHDAPVRGATVAIDQPGDRVTLTDAAGAFVLEYVTQPVGGISISVAEVTATGTLPACVDKLVWIGVHTRSETSAAVLRIEDHSLDYAAIQRAAERRQALASQWLTLYEGLGAVVDGSHADCTQLAAGLEQFVTQNQPAITAVTQQQAAMSSAERERIKDTIDHQLASRAAAVHEKTKGIGPCENEPRVRRALHGFPR